MPVHMIWDDEKHTIVRCEGEGKWTWEEYHATLSEIVEAVKQVDHRVDLIITRQDGSSLPGGSPMPHFQRAMRIMPRNVGLVILLNTNTFARALVSMFSRIFASRQHAQLIMLGTLEEARAYIAAQRAETHTDTAKKAS
jgi:hypothetical protein